MSVAKKNDLQNKVLGIPFLSFYCKLLREIKRTLKDCNFAKKEILLRQ